MAVENSKASFPSEPSSGFRWKRIGVIVAVAGSILSTGFNYIDKALNISDKALGQWCKLVSCIPIEEIVKQLANDAPEIRIAAVQKLSAGNIKNVKDTRAAIKALESMINRRAPKLGEKNLDNTNIITEIASAIKELGELNEQRRKKKYDIVNPTISKVDLSGIDLSNGNLSEFTFLEVNASNANFSNVNFTKAKFRDMQIPRIVASKAIFTKATFESVCLEGAELRNSDWSYAEVKGSDLNNSNLKNAVLVGTLLLETRLQGVDLTGANVSMADFSRAMELGPRQLDKVETRDQAFKPPLGYFKFTRTVCN